MERGCCGLREGSTGQVLARDGFRGSGPLYIRSRDLQPEKDGEASGNFQPFENEAMV